MFELNSLKTIVGTRRDMAQCPLFTPRRGFYRFVTAANETTASFGLAESQYGTEAEAAAAYAKDRAAGYDVRCAGVFIRDRWCSSSRTEGPYEVVLQYVDDPVLRIHDRNDLFVGWLIHSLVGREVETATNILEQWFTKCFRGFGSPVRSSFASTTGRAWRASEVKAVFETAKTEPEAEPEADPTLTVVKAWLEASVSSVAKEIDRGRHDCADNEAIAENVIRVLLAKIHSDPAFDAVRVRN